MQNLFHQERARAKDLERIDITKWNNVYCRWRPVKCKKKSMSTETAYSIRGSERIKGLHCACEMMTYMNS